MTTEINGRLARLESLKKTQKHANAASHGRMVDRARIQRQQALVEEMRPQGELEILKEDLRRLLYPLVRQLNWGADDVQVITSIADVETARKMLATLNNVLENAKILPPSPDEWLNMRAERAQQKEEIEQDNLRKITQVRAQETLTNLIGGLPVHKEDLRWAAEMMELIPADQRAAVRENWLYHYSDTEISMESERYRNANLALLKAAQKAHPEYFAELEHTKKKPLRP